MMTLAGKTAVITGAGRGIGKAIAKKLASLGANIVINDIPSSTDAQATADEIVHSGGMAIVSLGDVRVYEDTERLMADAIAAFGSVDILVNNAGITRDTLIMRMSEKDFEDVIDINLKGAFYCIKAAYKPMSKQRSGSIINVSSVVGIMGNTGQANYSSSKAGLIGLTKSVAKEFASRKIRCNAIAPGFIESDMTAKLPEEVRNQYMAGIPLKEFGTPENVADVVAFLSTDMSAYVTGQVIQIDGGLLM